MSVAVVLFGLHLNLQSATISTPASGGTQVLWSAFEWHAKLHNGEIASSWEQLSDQVDPVAFRQTLGASPSERFTFYGQSGPSDSVKGQVVLLTNNTIVEDRRETPGRYIVWNKLGKFSIEWIGEKAATELFAKSKIDFPTLGIWQQPNTSHASKMMGREMPLNLDGKGNGGDATIETDTQPIQKPIKDGGIASPNGQTTKLPSTSNPEEKTPSAMQENHSWFPLMLALFAASGGVWLLMRKPSR